MKKTLLALIALTLLAAPVSAQTYPRVTTLAGNLSANGQVVSLASGTGIQANGALFIDAEFIPINVSNPCANTACTLVNVTRVGKPITHAASANVYVISAAAKPVIMLTASAAQRAGQCSTSTSNAPATALAGFSFLPIFDIDGSGAQYYCRRNGTAGTWVWNVTYPYNINGTAGSQPLAWP